MREGDNVNFGLLEEIIKQNRGNTVRISEDKMYATIELVAPEDGETYTEQDVIAILNENGVTKGILHDVIKQMLLEQRYYEEREVASGRIPIDGKDGEYIYHFNRNPRSAPMLLEDGSVDYHNMEFFASITKDQLIAEYVEPTDGVDGYDVCGKVLPARKGMPLPPLRGKHIYRSDDNKRYFSEIDGKVQIEDSGRIVISDVYIVKGDVDASTGNISFKGNVEIWGNVTTGYKVEAAGSISIDGMVEAATLKAGKDVIIKNGMNGNGKGFVIAGGDVEGRYFEQANVSCDGHLHANSIMNCYIECQDEVIISGKRGVLLAGRMHALKGLSVVNIGNMAQMPTYVKVGLEPRMRQDYENKRKQADLLIRDIEKLTNAQESLQRLHINEENKTVIEEQRRNVMRTKITKVSQLEHIKKECESIEEHIEVGKQASVMVEHWAYAGVSITINGATNNIKEDVKGVTFSLRKGNVVMNYND